MSPALEQAERLLPDLTRAEKAILLHRIAEEINGDFPGIEIRPDVCGGDPCIVRTRIPVWLLEQARRLGTIEAELLRAYPLLGAADLVNAWRYARAHQDEIDRLIQEHEGA